MYFIKQEYHSSAPKNAILKAEEWYSYKELLVLFT